MKLRFPRFRWQRGVEARPSLGRLRAQAQRCGKRRVAASGPLVLALAGGILMMASAAMGQDRLLYSFENEAERKTLTANNARIAPVAAFATEGARGIAIEYLPSEWPNLLFRPAQPWDWSRYGGLAFDLHNPGSEPVAFFVRVDDSPEADGVKHCRTGSGSIAPGQRRAFVFPLTGDPMEYGMRGLPPAGAQGQALSMQGGRLDHGHIVAFQIFLHRPAAPQTLHLDNVRLTPRALRLEGIVDAFGQYARADWPGKLKQEAEFAARRKAEEAELAAKPALPDRDRYGGWKDGPTLKATGFFRAEKLGDRWALVTPEGKPFFSLGMDCVNLWFDTVLTQRETMFSWLPAESDPLARHYGYASGLHSGPVKEGKTFNFYAANLERKYGRESFEPWKRTALKRLESWGFNTVANWSDERLYGNGQVPYVATVHIDGAHDRVSSGSDYWGKMHDPFDPRFADSVQRSLAPVVTKAKGDAWCIGYFVDNELSWGDGGEDGGRYGLALGALNSPAASRAKQAFLKQLRAKYGEVARLDAAWNVAFGSWSGLDAPFKPQGALTTAQKADMAAYVKEFARQYFRTVRDALKRADPDHLYLGCRFAWQTGEAVDAAAEFCDVVSFNIYRPRLEAKEWEWVNALNKPCIIGEFHFGALDRGMFHTGLVATPSQQARAAMYQDYVQSVLDHPAFVGCHWFQYGDEALTGRSLDGENYNIGFVTVTDTPYPEMVEAARAVHRAAYPRRFRR